MKKYALLVAALVLVLLMTGCDGRTDGMENIVSDPNSFAGFMMSFGGSLAFLLFLFAGLGLLRSVLHSIQITGGLTMAAGPLFYVQSHDAGTAIAVTICGLIAFSFATGIEMTFRKAARKNDDKDK